MKNSVKSNENCIVVIDGCSLSSTAFRAMFEAKKRITLPSSNMAIHGLERVQHRALKKAQLRSRMTTR